LPPACAAARYSRIETGKHDPGARTLVRIAAALRTMPADLSENV
jgi:transcriptional regulator with XRE-family HTH domain